MVENLQRMMEKNMPGDTEDDGKEYAGQWETGEKKWLAK